MSSGKDPNEQARRTSEAEPGGGGEGRPPTEEELRAAYEEQIRQVRVEHVLLENVVTLANLGMRRTGLAPGTEGERDPEQVRLAIESIRALMPALEQSAPQQVSAAMTGSDVSASVGPQQPGAQQDASAATVAARFAACAYRSPKRQVGRTVGQLIAGISLLDGLVLAASGSLLGIVFALVAFGLTLSLQRYVRGT